VSVAGRWILSCRRVPELRTWVQLSHGATQARWRKAEKTSTGSGTIQAPARRRRWKPCAQVCVPGFLAWALVTGSFARPGDDKGRQSKFFPAPRFPTLEGRKEYQCLAKLPVLAHAPCGGAVWRWSLLLAATLVPTRGDAADREAAAHARDTSPAGAAEATHRAAGAIRAGG
jgi:hypothetical protein